jgi:signal transduction histidine kinase
MYGIGPRNRIFWRLLGTFALLALVPLGWEVGRELRVFGRIRRIIGEDARQILVGDYGRQLEQMARDMAGRFDERRATLEKRLASLAEDVAGSIEAPPMDVPPIWKTGPGGFRFAREKGSLLLRLDEPKEESAALRDALATRDFSKEIEEILDTQEWTKSGYIWTAGGILRAVPYFEPTGPTGQAVPPTTVSILRSERFPPLRRAGPEPPPASWTGAYRDRFYGEQWIASCLSPSYGSDGRLLAIVGVDWRVMPLLDEVVGSTQVSIAAFDRGGRLLGFTPGILGALGIDEKGIEPSADVVAKASAKEKERLTKILGGAGAVTIGGNGPESWLVVSSRVGTSGWKILVGGRLAPELETADRLEGDIDAEVRNLRASAAAGIGVLFLLVLVSAWAASRSFARPLESLTDGAHRFEQGGEIGPLPTGRADEFGVLARAFRDAAQSAERRATLAAALHELSSTARFVGDQKRLVDELATVMRRLVGADECLLFAPVRGGELLEELEGSRAGAYRGERVRFGPSEAVFYGQVFRGGRTIIVDGKMEGSQLLPKLAASSILAAPLEAEGERIGVALAVSRSGAFGTAQLEAFGAAADPAGLVLRVSRLVRALEESGRELVDANRQKSYFLQNLNHEIRTPLTAVNGWAEMLEDFDILPEEQKRDAIVQLGRASRSLLSLVEDLLDMSRIESGSLSIRMEMVPLAPLFDDVVATIAPTAAARGVRILRGGGAPPDEAKAWADSVRLRQVVGNLLDNAVKFTDEGGEVELGLARREGGWAISIRDTGSGISPEELVRVFDRFRQADGRVSRKHRGMGIGLSLARSLVELMGGTISARSVPGTGSLFEVALLDRPRPPREGEGIVFVTGAGAPLIAQLVAAALHPKTARIRSVSLSELLGMALDLQPSAVVFDLDGGDPEEIAAAAATLRPQPRLSATRLVGIGDRPQGRESVADALDAVLSRTDPPEILRRILLFTP